MKKKLTQWIFHRIAYSHSIFLEKLVIILNVLFHDWRIHPAYGSVPAIGNIAREELLKTYNDIDNDSLQQLLRFHEACRYPELADSNKTLFFYNADKILTKEERRQQHKIKKELVEIYNKFNLYIDVEAGYHHHGLREIEQSREYTKNKIFIDAGACFGDSAIIFLDQYEPSKVYSFEPSALNCSEYMKNLRKNHFPEGKYELVQKGVSDQCETLSFHDTGMGGTNLSSEGESSVDVVTLDDFCGCLTDSVGVIKADVEGFGLKLIRGAERTIRKNRPILCLSIYHNEEECLGIYRCLKEWNLNYSFKIRLHRLPFQVHELDLIAYPDEIWRNP